MVDLPAVFLYCVGLCDSLLYAIIILCVFVPFTNYGKVNSLTDKKGLKN